MIVGGSIFAVGIFLYAKSFAWFEADKVSADELTFFAIIGVALIIAGCVLGVALTIPTV